MTVPQRDFNPGHEWRNVMDRRYFIQSSSALAAAAALTGWISPLEASLPTTAEGRDGFGLHQSVLILGIGGAGCNVVEQLSGRPGIPRPQRVGRMEETRPLDLRLTGSTDSELCGDDAELLSRAVASAELTIVVAGLGGSTGNYVAPYVVEQAKLHGGRCVEVYCLPFSFEGNERHMRSHRALARRFRVADQARIFAHDESLADAPLDHILAHTDSAMVDAVLEALSDYRSAHRPTWAGPSGPSR